MGKYICGVCGYVFDEADGTSWEALPEDWVCPLCGASKSEFEKQGGPTAAPAAKKPLPVSAPEEDMKALTALEVSALCSNLARGCEKQYKAEQAELFTRMSAYFKSVAAPAETADFGRLAALIEEDLASGFPEANAAGSAHADRGALRALVWSEKVTRILKSLLTRYEREGEAMMENTGVYVCTICGFIYVGDSLPEICPVCKVPNWKFEKVQGR